MTTIFCANARQPEWRIDTTIAYYRGAMGLLLVYDVTDESSFNNIRNWIRNIEQHAFGNVKKVLDDNKADMDESKRDVPTSRGQAFADEYGIKFSEISAKMSMNVDEVYFSIAQDIKQRLSDSDSKSEETQHSELENLFPECGKVVHVDMKKAYYRGAMGLLLLYDVTDESSFNNIRNWIRNIEQHAFGNVKKVLVDNKADMDESKRDVPTSRGQALADKYGIKFSETSAKMNMNVDEVYFSIALDIKQRLSDSDSKSEETQHSELENLFPECGKVVHVDMKKGYDFGIFKEQLDGTSFDKCIVDWVTDLDAIHDWGRKILFDTKCRTYRPPYLHFVFGRSRPRDTAGLTTIPNDNRGSDGSSSSNSSDNSSGGDDDGAGGSDNSSDEGGIDGINGFIMVLRLESDEIMLTDRNANKLFGANPHTRSHVICVLPQENDPEVGRAGKNFEVVLVGEGSFTFETGEGSVINVQSEWNYRIEDKPWQEEEGRPSWREEVLRQVYVRNAVAVVFGNQSGQVNVLFAV